MIDKVGIKINPKQSISVQIGDTIPDILLYCKEVLQVIKPPKMTPKRYAKYAYLSLSAFREKRSYRHAENEQKAKNGVGIFV